MNFYEQMMQMPYAYTLLPIAAFLTVVAGVGWFWWPTSQLDADASEEKEKAAAPTVAAPKAKDQREAHRRLGNPVSVYVAMPENKQEPSVGSVLDRSVGGMRLALYSEVAPSAVLSIRPVHANDMVPWIDLEVRSCRPSTEMPGHFEVGCQYVKSPPYSLQLLFG